MNRAASKEHLMNSWSKEQVVDALLWWINNADVVE